MEIIKKYYQMDKTKISFLRYILEAYDGVAVLTTIDKNEGVVVLRTSPGFEDEVKIIISDLTEAISIKPYEIEEN
ncbi:MAG: DUF4911 domain-containing protein [Desulfobacterales bacterium]|nr:DUF4911 domain-containing protein [Desulfobacterales bacterium]MCP4163523.1 DUF4911 domain-containing protein [Deltaproteobacteria bacterium]